MKYFASLFGILCALALLGGCDIASEQRIGGAPINTPDADLDPDEAANVAAYFYLDRPVVGLNYLCQGVSAIPIVSKTDSNGRFVCPRRSVVSFFLGVEGQALVLGTLSLEIFGRQDDDDKRNYVVITPATLVGAGADGSRYEVANMFNLLTALDLGTTDARAKIRLESGGLDVNPVIAPFLDDLNLRSSPNAFAVSAEPMLEALQEELDIELPGGGVMFPEGTVEALADLALSKTYAGIYKNISPLTAFNDEVRQSVTSSAQLLVGRNGLISGIGTALELDGTTSPATVSLELLEMSDGAAISPSGLLKDIVLRGESGRALTLGGRFINDRVYGSDTLLDPTQNHRIFPNYTLKEADLGTFDVDDLFSGELTLYHFASSTPDVELELMPLDTTPDASPGAYLPLDFAIFFKGYPLGSNTPEADREDPSKLVALDAAVSPLRMRIRPDGDIVSDINGDCSDVTLSGGELRDASGQQEYLIGQVGSVFQDENKVAYMTLLLTVFNSGHPAFGFTFGIDSLFNPLTPVVLNTLTGELRSKRCPPDEACEVPLRWFNDAVFIRDVYGPDLAAGAPPADNPDRDKVLYNRPDYVGEVVDSTRYCLVVTD